MSVCSFFGNADTRHTIDRHEHLDVKRGDAVLHVIANGHDFHRMDRTIHLQKYEDLARHRSRSGKIGALQWIHWFVGPQWMVVDPVPKMRAKIMWYLTIESKLKTHSWHHTHVVTSILFHFNFPNFMSFSGLQDFHLYFFNFARLFNAPEAFQGVAGGQKDWKAHQTRLSWPGGRPAGPADMRRVVTLNSLRFLSRYFRTYIYTYTYYIFIW